MTRILALLALLAAPAAADLEGNVVSSSSRPIVVDGINLRNNRGRLDTTNNYFLFGTTRPPAGYGVRLVSSGTAVFQSTSTTSTYPVLRVNNSSSSEILRVTQQGRVGIGTASPSQALDVSGTVNATAFTGSGAGLSGISGAIPVGGVTMYISTTNIPAGWLLCDGSAVNRTTYADLFAVIGSSFGAGDGSSTFNLPDFRSRIPIGAGAGASLTERSLATTGGGESITLTTTELPSHKHALRAKNASGNTNTLDGNAVLAQTSSGFIWNSGGAVDATVDSDSIDNTGTGSAFSIMNPWLSIGFLIKH